MDDVKMFTFFLVEGKDKNKYRDAFINSLIEKYEIPIFNHIYSKIYLKSKDEINYCLNAVYIAAFENYHKIKDYKDLLPWLLRVADNTTITENRKYLTRKNYQIHIDSKIEKIVNNIQDSSLKIDEKVVNDMIYDDYVKDNRADEILKSLPPEELVLYRLKYVKKFADSEIAKELNIPVNTAKTKVRRLRKKVELMVYNKSGN